MSLEKYRGQPLYQSANIPEEFKTVQQWRREHRRPSDGAKPEAYAYESQTNSYAPLFSSKNTQFSKKKTSANQRSKQQARKRAEELGISYQQARNMYRPEKTS